MDLQRAVVAAMTVVIILGAIHYFAGLQARRGRRSLWSLLVIVLCAGAAFGGSLAVDAVMQHHRTTAAEKAVQAIKDTPLIGAVVKDHPDLEAKLREALSFSPPDMNQVKAVVAHARADFALPAFRSSDDNSVLAIWDKRTELFQHMNATAQFASCKEYLLSDIATMDNLDLRGRAIHGELLAVEEVAYHNGKGRPARLNPIERELIATLLGMLTASDLAIYQNPQAALPEQVCKAGLGFHVNVKSLPASARSILARHLIAPAE